MNEEQKDLEQQVEEQEVQEVQNDGEYLDFEPSPRWKRIGAWILFGIIILAVINWLVSIPYPDWPQRVMEMLK